MHLITQELIQSVREALEPGLSQDDVLGRQALDYLCDIVFRQQQQLDHLQEMMLRHLSTRLEVEFQWQADLLREGRVQLQDVPTV